MDSAGVKPVCLPYQPGLANLQLASHASYTLPHLHPSPLAGVSLAKGTSWDASRENSHCCLKRRFGRSQDPDRRSSFVLSPPFLTASDCRLLTCSLKGESMWVAIISVLLPPRTPAGSRRKGSGSRFNLHVTLPEEPSKMAGLGPGRDWLVELSPSLSVCSPGGT